MANLVSLEPKGKIVFIGDIHGEFETLDFIVKKYTPAEYILVPLGDYVDRGNRSRDTADYVIELRKRFPLRFFPLRGNHEVCPKEEERLGSYPFWDNPNSDFKWDYTDAFSQFPIALSVGNILAVHGALPDVPFLQDIDKLPEEDKDWKAIVYGDFVETKEQRLQVADGLRPCYTQLYFDMLMERFGKSVLIRAHDPDAPLRMYNNQCLTLFTSRDHARPKKFIAIADFTKNPKISSIDDLVIEQIGEAIDTEG